MRKASLRGGANGIHTTQPRAGARMTVIGIPLREQDENSVSKELAALLSTLETPPGIPVATVGFNDVVNAACLAAQILGVKDRRVRAKLEEFRTRRRQEAHEKAINVQKAAAEIQGH